MSDDSIKSGNFNAANYSFAPFNQTYAGGYQLGNPHGLKIMIKKKPIWLHRKMMKLCFGWEWIDT